MRRLTAAAALGVLLCSSTLLADIPAPRPRPKPPVAPETPKVPAKAAPFVVKIDDSAEQARLEIPVKFLLGEVPGKRVDGGKRTGISPGHAMIAAIALSMALAGLVVVRKRPSKARVLTMLIVGGVSLAAVGSLLANVGEPPPPSNTEGATSGSRPESIAVEVKVVKEGEAITLVISGKQYTQFTPAPGGAVEKVSAEPKSRLVPPGGAARTNSAPANPNPEPRR